MQAILWDRLPIAKIVNVKVINLEQAPEGYKYFDAGRRKQIRHRSAWIVAQGRLTWKGLYWHRHSRSVPPRSGSGTTDRQQYDVRRRPLWPGSHPNQVFVALAKPPPAKQTCIRTNETGSHTGCDESQRARSCYERTRTIFCRAPCKECRHTRSPHRPARLVEHPGDGSATRCRAQREPAPPIRCYKVINSCHQTRAGDLPVRSGKT